MLQSCHARQKTSNNCEAQLKQLTHAVTVENSRMTKPTDAGWELLARYDQYETLAISMENPFTPSDLRLKVIGLILLDLFTLSTDAPAASCPPKDPQ